jgi:hypothetical protein
VTVEEEDTKPDVEEDPEEDPKNDALHREGEHKKKQKKKYKPKASQYSLEAGLKHFGERGEMAVSKELKQFNVYDVFKPLYADKLSKEEKLKALKSLIVFREKQDGNVKARSCANRSVQREHATKEEAAA